jgi:predicted nucleic acid-binding protein
MSRIFADTCYWFALLNRKDQLHKPAMSAAAQIGNAMLITTDEILAELLNHAGKFDAQFRRAAVKLVDDVRSAGQCRGRSAIA